MKAARRAGGLLMVLVMTLAGACSGGSERETGPDYEPVPDRELFAQVAQLPGVTRVDISFQDTFTSGRGYVGTVEVDADAEPSAVLDQAMAVLRQGRWRASITLDVRQGTRSTTFVDLGMASGTEPDLVERYGPQPGDGSPPDQGQP